MPKTNVSSDFNIAEVNQRYLKIFGEGAGVNKVGKLIQDVSNLPDILSEYGEHPLNSVNYIVSEFLDLSKESKKENGEVEFYYSKRSKTHLLESLPRSARKLIKSFVHENIGEFKNSKNAHLENLAGVFYLYGIGVKEDGLEALKCFEKSGLDQIKIAQVSQDSRRLFDISECYHNNVGSSKGADDGSGFGALTTSVIYSRNAFNYCEAAADLGCVHAQYIAGINNIKSNPSRAVKLFELAAEKKVVQATHELGKCYANGIGVEKNALRAVSLFESAADGKYANSQFEMGRRHFTGDAVEKDHAKALKYLIGAIENGSGEALVALSKPTILSKLTNQLFVVIDKNFLTTPLSQDEILHVVDVMGRIQPMDARLQDPRSGFIGKLVEANQESLNLSELFKIQDSLTEVINNRSTNIFSACWSREQKSLNMIHNCMFNKVENFLKGEGIRREYVAGGKFNFEYDDERGILCKFSKPNANHSYSQIIPETNPIDDAIRDRLREFTNDEYQIGSDHFFLVFNKANSRKVTQDGVLTDSVAMDEAQDPAGSICALTSRQLKYRQVMRES